MTIGEPLGIKVGLVSGGNIEKKLADERRYNVDVLVGSFGGLEKLLRGGKYSARALRHLVYDEADTLLDDTFNKDSVPLVPFLTRRGVADFQVLLVGATFPTSLKSIMGSVMEEDELEQMTTTYTHRVRWVTFLGKTMRKTKFYSAKPFLLLWPSPPNVHKIDTRY